MNKKPTYNTEITLKNMDYFSWGLIAIVGCYSLKNAETKQSKNLYIGLYGAIFIIGIAYMSGEQLGEAIYYLSQKNTLPDFNIKPSTFSGTSRA